MNPLTRPVCRRLGCSHPIVLAATGKMRRADRVAAVSEAGGFSLIDMAAASPQLIEAEVTRLSRRSNRCFGVTFNPETVEAALLGQQIRAAVALGVAAVGFSSDPGAGAIRRLSECGVIVMRAAVTVAEAVAAEQAGARVLIAALNMPGGEGLLADIVAATTVPVLAAGSMGEAKNAALALALGADGVVITSPERFLPLLAEAGLLLGPDVPAVAEERTSFASPVCYLAELDDAAAGFAGRDELLALFNPLLEAARAGVRTAPADADELRWCGVLESAILALGGSPARGSAAWFGKPGAAEELARERERRASAIGAMLLKIRNEAVHAALAAMLAKPHV